MRSLTATLEAAQQAASFAPYVEAKLQDYRGDRQRLRFTRYYTGEETEANGACCLAGDGSLNRGRVDPATDTVYTQRVTTPGSGSDYSSWTSHGAQSAQELVALTARGAEVRLFYVDADGVTVKCKLSSDNGASFGAAATVATALATVVALAAAYATDGDVACFWAEGGTVYRSRYTAGSWGARTAWTNSAATVTGLACRYYFDWAVVVTGTEPTTTDAKVWGCIFGDGTEEAADAWSGLAEISSAVSGSSVAFQAPALDILEDWRLWFVEAYTGDAAYTRLCYATMDIGLSLVNETWSEPEAWDYTGEHGVRSATSDLDGPVWLSAPAGVWYAAATSGAVLDVSEDVVDADVELGPEGGKVRLVLRNDDGRYNTLGSGANALLRRGCRLALSFGYWTTSGAEASTGPGYQVERFEHVSEGGKAELVVHAGDAWSLLEAWRSRRTYQWAAGAMNVFQLLGFVLGRAGLGYDTLSSSSALTDLYPAFVIHPGETGATAVRRLLEHVPDVVIMRAGTAWGRYPQAADASQYAYGTDHAVLGGRYREEGLAVNRARVFGLGVFAESFDFDEIEAVGERVGLVQDVGLTASADASDRADWELRRSEISERADEVLAPVSCGQELYDVVSVTDSQVGLAAELRRVVGLRYRYSTGTRPRYDLRLVLGSV